MTEEILRKAAFEIERELICCDAYEQGPDHLKQSNPHHICYWGGAARAIVMSLSDAEREENIGQIITVDYEEVARIITDEINADPEEVGRLRRAREQAREGRTVSLRDIPEL